MKCCFSKVDSTKYQLGCMTLEVAWSLLSDGYQFDFPSINPSLFTVMIKRLTLEKSALQYMKEQTVSFEEMMLALSGQFKQLSHMCT